MRVIIAGSRSFNDYPRLKRFVSDTLNELYLQERIGGVEEILIITGGARGADAMGERYAKENFLDSTVMKADWDTFGKSAGYRRNEKMAKYAQEDDGALIAFWDGQSKGTKHMIDLAQKYQLEVFICRFDQKE
jgi:hypothetical protein